MVSALFILNTSTLSFKEILKILKLAGFLHQQKLAQMANDDQKMVRELSDLLRLYLDTERKHFFFDKIELTAQSDRNLHDIEAVKNQITLIYEPKEKSWYILTLVPNTKQRFLKKIEALSQEEVDCAYLAGLNIELLKNACTNKEKLKPKEWIWIKSFCFAYVNPLEKIRNLFCASLDNVSPDQAIKTINLREYIKNTFIRKTDIFLLLYANSSHSDYCGENEIKYIKQSLSQARSALQHEVLSLIYIGGGHGWPKEVRDNKAMLSGIPWLRLKSILQVLKELQIKSYSVVLGSCFSASFVEEFSFLMMKKGLILSSTLSLGHSNYFKNALRVALFSEKPKPFFKNTSYYTRMPTGICITQVNRHLGLKCIPKTRHGGTGLPKSSAQDEYRISKEIIQTLCSGSRDADFPSSLEECSHDKQKRRFNYFLSQALTKEGVPLMIKLGFLFKLLIISGLGLNVLKIFIRPEEKKWCNPTNIGLSLAASFGLYRLFKDRVQADEEGYKMLAQDF